MPPFEARILARWLFDRAVDAVKPDTAIRSFVQRIDNVLTVGEFAFDLSSYRRVYLVGAGKASALMGDTLARILGEYLSDSLVCTKYGHKLAGETPLTVVEAAHPVPDDASVAAATQILSLLKQATHEDLVLCVVSGGASALLAAPTPPLTLSDKKAVTSALLQCGAPIHTMNIVRKHLSQIKGGRLAAAAAPAHVISLVLSDVAGDDLHTIASGVSVPDADDSTSAAAAEALQQWGVYDRLPPDVADRVRGVLSNISSETPKASAWGGSWWWEARSTPLRVVLRRLPSSIGHPIILRSCLFVQLLYWWAPPLTQ